MVSYSPAPPTEHFTCYLNRTNHVGLIFVLKELSLSYFFAILSGTSWE